MYSCSFRPQDWPQHFSRQEVLRAYFSDSATQYGLREHIRFNTEATTARFDEDDGRWRVEITGSDGAKRALIDDGTEHEFDVLIYATGS